jgi:putative aldouronate transport system permease protein
MKTKQADQALARPMSPLLKGIRRDWQLILIMLPAVIILGIFAYGSMFGILYSFQDVGLRRTFWENEWVGFKWFKKFFDSVYCERVIWNTLILNFWSLVAGTSVEILLALIFNEVKDGKFKRFTQSCSYFPNFVSTTVVVGIMITMLNPNSGVLSLLFQNVFGMEPIDMFVEPSLFRPLYVISGIWQGAGWGSIIYLGAINGIDQSLYEAAAVDGCGRLARIRHVTLPGMKQVIVTCLILHIGSMLSLGSGKILLMYSPSVYETADVISTFVYRTGFDGAGGLGYSAAVGLFNSVVNLLLLLITNTISNKVAETSLF